MRVSWLSNHPLNSRRTVPRRLIVTLTPRALFAERDTFEVPVEILVRCDEDARAGRRLTGQEH